MTPTQHDHDDAPRPAAGRSGASRVGCARREHHTGLDASRPVGPVGATAGGYRDSGPGDDWPSDDVPATCHTTRPALTITTTLPPRVGPLAKSITHTRSVTPPMLCGTLRDRALSTHDDRHIGKNDHRRMAPAGMPAPAQVGRAPFPILICGDVLASGALAGLAPVRRRGAPSRSEGGEARRAVTGSVRSRPPAQLSVCKTSVRTWCGCH
jgi:hypothetical protein